MEVVLLRIRHQPHFLFSELFEASTTITTIVASFLAVLELTRLNKILIQQDSAFGDIRCMRVEHPDLTAPKFD